MDLVVLLSTFVVIFPVELPDKTMVATLVLATRYDALPVWLGVCVAFFVQSLIAVTAGGLLTLLPRQPLLAVAAALFAAGAMILLYGAGHASEEEAEEEVEYTKQVAARPLATGTRAAVTSFLVLFAAEWGDLSQIATAGLVVRDGEPVAVLLGSWLALATVAALAVLVGRSLLRWVPLALVRRIAGITFAVLAVITAIEATGVDLFSL